MDENDEIENQTASEYVNELMSRMSSHLDSIRRSESQQRSPEPRHTALAFVTPNDKIPEDRKSDIISEITENTKNDENIEYEQELANRWNIKNFMKLEDFKQQI